MARAQEGDVPAGPRQSDERRALSKSARSATRKSDPAGAAAESAGVPGNRAGRDGPSRENGQEMMPGGGAAAVGAFRWLPGRMHGLGACGVVWVV